MKVSFEGIGERTVTFFNKDTGGAAAGEPVCMRETATVGKAAAGEKFFGVATAVSQGCAAVQTEGFVRMKYSGTAPAVGYALLTADGNGGVKAPGTGDKAGEFLVVEIDSSNMLLGLML